MAALRQFLVFLCLGAACFAQHPRRKCADVPIKTTDGKTIRVSQYHDKVVMIVMIVTTDNDCLRTMQFMGRLQNEMGARGLQIVGASIDDTAANVVPFAERYRFPFPIGHLNRAAAIKLADLNGTAQPVVPYVMFVDWQGSVRFQYPGNDPIFNDSEKNLRALADGLLRQAAEKQGPHLETGPVGKQ
jgi:peroxiredoxin